MPQAAGEGEGVSIHVMSQVWAKSPQQGGHLLVLLAIADFADDNGVAWPSVSTLGRKARLSETSIHRILRQLQEAGELRIEREAGPHGCNLYVVGGTGAKIAPGAVGDTGGVPPVAPKPSIEPSGVASPEEDSATEVATSSSAPKGAKRKVSQTGEIIQPDRVKLHEKWDAKLGPERVEDQIELALAYKSARNYTNLHRYVNNWLDNDANRRWNDPARNGAPAPARAPIDWSKGNSPPMSAEQRAYAEKLLEGDREKERQRAAKTPA
jgi:hypothetical protein